MVCGGVVTPGRRSRKYCSPACRQAGHRTKDARPESFACRLCGKTVSIKERDSRGRLIRSDISWCRDCGRDSPDALRLKQYGITPDEYARALARGCVICKKVDVKLHVDHDHACCPGKRTCGECVRGLICGPCNRGIGLFFDDAAALRAAADYLTR